jgi:hypothetical protein
MSEQSTMMKDHITIEGRDGAFGAYISRPKTLPAPAVVVRRPPSRTCPYSAERQSSAVAFHL